MARLNEAPVPVESHLEILRRKFLRQNRDIAKINSDQSQKIRRLENDCGRLLSENLDLRGQILRLEKQVEDNSARRIADHALEVKAKLEEQLSGFAALLADLGAEPPAKRRSLGDRTTSRSRQSMARSPQFRGRRTTSIDSDTLAEMEGRLPPIYENKSYPRATMNTEEIMALCAAADDTNDSSELGPPPIAHFVEDEPVKHSPARDEEFAPETTRRPATILSPPKLSYVRQPSRSPELEKEAEEHIVKPTSPTKNTPSPRKPVSEPTLQPVKTGAKRKYGDENGTSQSTTPLAGQENSVLTEKPFPTRGGHKKRTLAELANVKPEKKTGKAPLSGKRTPLAAKSTNEDVSSPRKTSKPAVKEVKEVKKGRALEVNDVIMKDEVHAPRKPVEIVIPTDQALLESATSLLSATPSSPTTPHRQAQTEVPHDTPPPADISSTGETIRPSRRARAAVSYAEPNLRDKMRRPTKELFDAVAGEGKYAHRASLKPDDQHSAPTSTTKIKLEPTSSSSNKITTVNERPAETHPALLSPLAQKDALSDTFPSTVVLERRKRPSAVAASRESLSTSLASEPNPTTASVAQESAPSDHKRHKGSSSKTNTATNQVPSAASTEETDIYDFTASSPALSRQSASKSTASTTTEPSAPPPSSSASRLRPTRKSSMVAAAALRETFDSDDDEDDNSTIKNPKLPPPPSTKTSRSDGRGGRKRASMLAPKKSSMLENLEDADSVIVAADADISSASTSTTEGDGSSGSVGGRISRRRSMML
ncbi:hypothetical protein B0J18DRAFT_384101 [Chaetomium sp. MPI-SDFR-AT-0129]|nr:hypothetical protein B0J18DRAFT_384101 [Chaetomium sp. MPI-SDFR-AT-0129]